MVFLYEGRYFVFYRELERFLVYRLKLFEGFVRVENELLFFKRIVHEDENFVIIQNADFRIRKILLPFQWSKYGSHFVQLILIFSGRILSSEIKVLRPNEVDTLFQIVQLASTNDPVTFIMTENPSQQSVANRPEIKLPLKRKLTSFLGQWVQKPSRRGVSMNEVSRARESVACTLIFQ